MKKKHEIKSVNGTTFVNIPGVGTGIYQASMSGYDDNMSAQKVWEFEPVTVCGAAIVPYGADNNLPIIIRDIMDENNLAPGILEREKGLLWGNGPELYKKEYENGQIVRKWVDDPEIWNWLRSWDYTQYIEMAMTEYKYLHGYFDKIYLNKGARIGNGKIAKLEVIPGVDARLGWTPTRRLEDVKAIYVGDFENDCTKGITKYPAFNPQNPFGNRVSVAYRKGYTFARNMYALPSFYGTIPWIKRSSDVPQILKYITDNSITAPFHIESPEAYWEKMEDKLKMDALNAGKEYKDEMLEEHKLDVLDKLAGALSGKKNVGKFFHSVSIRNDDGEESVWKISPIDQKITDFISAQIKVSEKADSATTSGIGLHPSLSNIMVDGKLSSGSEMLYALKLYLASDTVIPEEIILQGINKAIEINFPQKKLRLGFYHQIVYREQEVSPSKRTTNTI
ncbi:MAG: hypothetical protein ACRDDZ_05840 [Marinifilaceae bacterium]